MKLTQIAQHAEDLDRAAEFYTALLGSAPAAVFDPPGLLFSISTASGSFWSGVRRRR